MDPIQQRIKIAEACGIAVEDGDHSPGTPWPALPDYLNSLNAMHEAEQFYFTSYATSASFELRISFYCAELHKLLPPGASIAHATATQRAEAFLKTLNLWEE